MLELFNDENFQVNTVEEEEEEEDLQLQSGRCSVVVIFEVEPPETPLH